MQPQPQERPASDTLSVAPEDPLLVMEELYYPLDTYVRSGCTVSDLEAAVLGPQLLTLRYWLKDRDEAPYRVVQTYSGSFAVYWNEALI